MRIEKRQIKGQPLTVIVEYPERNEAVDNLVRKIRLVIHLFWMAFIYVGIVLVLAYFVDAIRTKKDIDFINSKIKSKS